MSQGPRIGIVAGRVGRWVAIIDLGCVGQTSRLPHHQRQVSQDEWPDWVLGCTERVQAALRQDWVVEDRVRFIR